MKKIYLEETKAELVDRRENFIGRFAEAVRARKNTRRVSDELKRTNEFLLRLEQIEFENAPEANVGLRRYAVSSLFLHECFKKLTADRDEQFFFITGMEIGGVAVLDQWAEFTHQQRTRVGVVADMPSTHNLLIRLEQFGHKFLAHFHSHPGNGPSSTNPSGTDENFQERLERAGHMAIMAIFSRDGFVRFLRHDQNFEIQIYGQGVEKHAPGIYRLTNIY